MKKYKWYAVVALLSLALGYWISPEKVRIEKEVVKVEVERKSKATDLDRGKTLIEVTRPDGTKIRKLKTDVKYRAHESAEKQKVEQQKEVKIVESTRSRVTISALAGAPVSNSSAGFVYGVHVSKPLLGPITFGVWGITTGILGLSVGLQF